MRRVNGVLKEGGLLALSTPNVDGLFPKASYQIGKRIDYWPHPEPPFHLYQFSKQTITALLERTGFRVVEMQDRRIPIGYTYGRA
jgi:predicted TPR repeat methyltransferase